MNLSEKKYRIVLLDVNGFEISERFADTIKAADLEMRYMASESWAEMGETTHNYLGSFKVEIQCKNECVADLFVFPDSEHE